MSKTSIEKVEQHIPFVVALPKKKQDVDALLKCDCQDGLAIPEDLAGHWAAVQPVERP